MEEDKPSLIDYYSAQHDWLSERFSWNQQHTGERLLDLSGFIASISTQLEPEFHDPEDRSVPLGFFEVEQPSRIRYVHIIFIFTIFERRIRTLCRVVCESDPEVTCSLSDLRGTLFDRLKEFCGKLAKISLPDAKLWESLQELQKIRDCIVHCGGCARESRDFEYINKLVRQNRGLYLSSFGYIQIEQTYCSRAQDIVFEFLTAAFAEAHTSIRTRLLARQSAKDSF